MKTIKDYYNYVKCYYIVLIILVLSFMIGISIAINYNYDMRVEENKAIKIPSSPWESESEWESESASEWESETPLNYYYYFEGKVQDADTGDPIKGVTVTFIKENKSADDFDQLYTYTGTTNAEGTYRVNVPRGRYTYLATHGNYVIYSSSPELVEVPMEWSIQLTPELGEIHREDNHLVIGISMDRRPETVLLITTSLLSQTDDLEDAISRYSDTLLRKRGLSVKYIVLDSEECLAEYGVRLEDKWVDMAFSDERYGIRFRATKEVLHEIIEQTGPAYIIILGGGSVVQQPFVITRSSRTILSTWGDAWYVDFDNDLVVDPGFAVGRLPDVYEESSGIVAALETSIALHEVGGFGMSPEIFFGSVCWSNPPYGLGDICSPTAISCGVCYNYPPYGFCDDCDRREETINLISSNDYIQFTGHGSRHGFSLCDDSDVRYFSVENVEDVDLGHHPLIVAIGPCSTALLRDGTLDSPTLATEFLRAGAAAFIGRTTEEGPPNYFGLKFQPYYTTSDNIASGNYCIGDAIYELMRASTEVVVGEEVKTGVGQYCFYGDPTLKRRSEYAVGGFMSTSLGSLLFPLGNG